MFPAAPRVSGSVLRARRKNGDQFYAKYRVNGRQFRLASSISSPDRNTMHRKPSHFGSYCQFRPSGISSTLCASIGMYGTRRGRVTISVRVSGSAGGLRGSGRPREDC